MKDVLTAAARVMAMENGASFTAMPGVAYDLTDCALSTMARALLGQFDGTGIDLISLGRTGDTLVARIDEAAAEEPLCPLAFDRVVRKLSWQLLGQVWTGRIDIDAALTPTPVSHELVRVA
ncbi:MAG TPA: hypothetical protein VD969_04250 [Symbiobacteriaceae bacterium]|nr:hypothetical protein [Symbiobacteriaceae bacterium]